MESLLGLKREGERLYIRPVLPSTWCAFTTDYRFRETDYHIAVQRDDGLETGEQVSLDGTAQVEKGVALVDDGKEHRIEVRYRPRLQNPSRAGSVS
ncbi:MAG TPA: hypothetical protein VIM98_12915 [Dyella sp.]